MMNIERQAPPDEQGPAVPTLGRLRDVEDPPHSVRRATGWSAGRSPAGGSSSARLASCALGRGGGSGSCGGGASEPNMSSSALPFEQ